MPTNELAEQLYGELVGTCDSLPDWVKDHELEMQILEAFDQEASSAAPAIGGVV